VGQQGAKGDTGADSTVPGPQGPAGPQGPQGPQGQSSPFPDSPLTSLFTPPTGGASVSFSCVDVSTCFPGLTIYVKGWAGGSEFWSGVVESVSGNTVTAKSI